MQHQLLINGELVSGEGEKQPVYNPATGEVLLEIAEASPAQVDAAVLAALDAVRRAGMNKRVEYISFSKNICEQLIANGPKGIKVAYLGGDLSPRELAERGYTGLDYHIGTMRAHEEWFDEARKLGLEINVWTVNDEGSMKYLIGKGVDYITTDEPELLQSLLGK